MPDEAKFWRDTFITRYNEPLATYSEFTGKICFPTRKKKVVHLLVHCHMLHHADNRMAALYTMLPGGGGGFRKQNKAKWYGCSSCANDEDV